MPKNKITDVWEPIIEEQTVPKVFKKILTEAALKTEEISKENKKTPIRDRIEDLILEIIPDEADDEFLNQIQGIQGDES